MNLGEVRALFVKRSGRYDLVNDDDSDNGADLFINSGSRMLDRLRANPGEMSRVFAALAADVYYTTFDDCRSVKEVFINTSEARTELEKKDIGWVWREYFTVPTADLDNGTPLYYARGVLRSQDDSDKDDQGAFPTYVIDDPEGIVGIVIVPPPDEAIVVEVIGQFYSTTLSDDADINYWSVAHPLLLIMAAAYHLEVIHRNSTGAKDWMASITLQMDDINRDVIEEEEPLGDEMEG